MAREKLIPLIVMLAAVVVAAVTITLMLTRPKSSGIRYWDCLKCGNTFENREKSAIPIDCPVSGCDGQAVQIAYRNCIGCGEKVPAGHTREIDGQIMSQYFYKKDDGSYGWSRWLVLPTPADSELMSNSIWKCPKCDN